MMLKGYKQSIKKTTFVNVSIYRLRYYKTLQFVVAFYSHYEAAQTDLGGFTTSLKFYFGYIFCCRFGTRFVFTAVLPTCNQNAALCKSALYLLGSFIFMFSSVSAVSCCFQTFPPSPSATFFLQIDDCPHPADPLSSRLYSSFAQRKASVSLCFRCLFLWSLI